jgi:1-acyl-sn-glycerol-3-phosphate acyltransferase
VKFKSSLFSLAADPATGAFLPVQPISIIMDRVDGRVPAAGPNDVRDLYAWHGDMTMGPHLWNFVKSRGATIRLVFHPVLDPQVYNDRKLLADAAWNTVREGVTGPALPASTLAAVAIGG